MALSDADFSKQFYAAFTYLEKLQLAIREGRYTIWIRANPPNFPEEVLAPILGLPANTPVTRKAPRRSGGAGLNYVLELRYVYSEMGRPLKVYLKGFFSHDASGKLVIEFGIQCLKDAE